MAMSLKSVELFYKRLAEINPKPKGELNYTNHYTMLVAVVLSAQSTDSGVNRATSELFTLVDTPEEMISIGEVNLIKYIKTIGLYRNKAKNIIALSRKLIDEYNGLVPDNFESLIQLPGVGRKTANVILNMAFGKPTMAVDTHIFRVSNRTGLAPGKNVNAVETSLLRRTPDEYMLNAHKWLILFGRYVCKARNPECLVCVNSDICQYKEKAIVA